MFRRIVLSALVSLASACGGGRPMEEGTINAGIDGYVYVTGPVTGVVVSAHALALDTGAEGAALGESDPTDSSGAFHVDLGNYTGPLVLVVHGAGGSYVEPASAVTVHWETTTELRAPFIAQTGITPGRLAIASGEQATLVVSPWTDWAYAYALARKLAGRDATVGDALGHSITDFRAHVEADFWTVVPRVMSDGTVGAWNDGVQTGVLLSGLSQLTADMASASHLSPAGVSSLALLSAVRQDLSDPDVQLDGIGPAGALDVGTCAVVCVLGPLTLRGDLQDAADAFLASTANTSGITPGDADQFLTDVAARVSELWPTSTAPVVTLVPSSFFDDNGVTAAVTGPGVGAVAYSGTGTQVTLSASPAAQFSKYASRYSATDDHLPVWHFRVGDNHSDEAALTLRGRLSRMNAQSQKVALTDWFPIPTADGDTYNRALVISSALHADVAVVSGTYILEVQATDTAGALSRLDCDMGIACVTWTQTLLPPPLRQRVGTDDPVCSDLEIPTGHGLTTSSCGNTFAFTAIANLTDTRKISLGFIDNPSPSPVQVTIAAAAPTFVRRGLLFENIHVATPRTVVGTCNEGIEPQLPNGTCFTPSPGMAEFGADEVLDRDLAAGVEVEGATLVGPAGGTGPVVYEIPALSTATVSIDSHAWGFLLPGPAAYHATLGTEMNLTATTARHWLSCNHISRIPPNDPNGVELCSLQWDMLETTSLTRVALRPTSSVSLTARPAGSDEATWVSATGTNVASFRYHDFRWESQMPGYVGF